MIQPFPDPGNSAQMFREGSFQTGLVSPFPWRTKVFVSSNNPVGKSMETLTVGHVDCKVCRTKPYVIVLYVTVILGENG